MTSANPPYPYFNGITYNSQFFNTSTSSSGGLTQAQANLLYLQKTTTDTASALETFSGGIATSSIDTAATGGALSVGGTNATGGITIGPSSATSLATINNPVLIPYYTTIPTFATNRIGYTIPAYLTTAVAITSLYNNASLLSLTLPIGVWACCYCVQAGPQFQQTGTITRFDTQMTIPSSTSGTPVNFGVSNNKSSQSVIFGTDVQSNGSAVITNATSQTLSLWVIIGFTSTNSQMIIIGSSTTPLVYLTATRIA